jgi:hypothetical protein
MQDTNWPNTRRNALCPCNSGKKFKHCHGSIDTAATPAAPQLPSDEWMRQMFAQEEAENRQREQQPGIGRSISSEALVRLISTEFPQQQSTQPKLAQGKPAPTSQRSDAAIGSAAQRESPMEVAQPSSRSLGQRFAARLPLIAGLAAVLVMAGVSLYVLVYLVAPPLDEKRAATTAPTLNAAPTVSADTAATAITTASATSPEPASEFSAKNSMPAPMKPPDEAAQIVAVAPGSLVPGATSTVPTPAPTKPPEEAAPIVAVAPGSPVSGIASTVPTPAPAKPADEAAPIVAVTLGSLVPGTASTVPTPAPVKPPEEPAPIVAVAPDAFAPGTAPAVAVPTPTGPPEKRRTPTAEISALLARGDSLFEVGDVASARLFYERATDAGDAQAALRLGETYDPYFLALARLKVVRGDLAVATRWYQRARDLGASEAEILLKSIENR